MWKNIIEGVRPQITIWRMRIPCWISKAADTHRLCNTHCLSTATMVAGTRLIVRLYVHYLSCSRLGLRVDALYTDNQARRKHDACIFLQFLVCFPIARYLKYE
jgi:hypothetical protein